MHVLAAPDKFKGTARATEVGAAVRAAVEACGHTCSVVPMSDGGDGFLDALGGPNRSTTVTGPLGDPVEAPWRLHRRQAVIEMACASGLVLAGGAEGNDPIAASTYGTGELIAAALEAGATRILVGAGGSATTDGGLGALRALHPTQRLRGVDLVVACDVRTRFVDAAEVFAAQKGASPAQVELLRRRLERLVQAYRSDYGVEVSDLVHGGAAGGLAGGLAAVGASLVSGFDLVADEVELDAHLEQADLVVTGEGFLDSESFDGKVVGGVAALAGGMGVPVLAVVGDVDTDPHGRPPAVPDPVEVRSLVREVGANRAVADPCGSVSEVVAAYLAEMPATDAPA